jgi:hypothetical protein
MFQDSQPGARPDGARLSDRRSLIGPISNPDILATMQHPSVNDEVRELASVFAAGGLSPQEEARVRGKLRTQQNQILPWTR